mgnify:CR=1
MKAFNNMVGRERFERSTSGLKAQAKTPKNSLYRPTKAFLYHSKTI